MSTPEPGPSGMTNFTGCCGQACAFAGDGAAPAKSAAEPQTIMAKIERRKLSMDVSWRETDDKFMNCGARAIYPADLPRVTHAYLRDWFFKWQEPGQFRRVCPGIFA